MATSDYIYKVQVTLTDGSVLDAGTIAIPSPEPPTPTPTLTFDDIYPIGSFYITDRNVSPASLFGGTWTQIQGRFLLASSSSYPLGNTSGSADAVVVSHRGHILHTDAYGGNAGEPTYYFSTGANVLSQYGQERPYVVRAGNELVLRDYYEGESGVGKNMPPYLVVNIWKRIEDEGE